jgi:hypothetical protein
MANGITLTNKKEANHPRSAILLKIKEYLLYTVSLSLIPILLSVALSFFFEKTYKSYLAFTEDFYFTTFVITIINVRDINKSRMFKESIIKILNYTIFASVLVMYVVITYEGLETNVPYKFTTKLFLYSIISFLSSIIIGLYVQISEGLLSKRRKKR